MIDAKQIVIAVNDAPQTGPCTLCSGDVFVPAGPAVVVADSRAPLCEGRAMETAPELLSLVRLGEAAMLHSAMADFAPRHEFAPGPEKAC